jgi:hypothetical protein
MVSKVQQGAIRPSSRLLPLAALVVSGGLASVGLAGGCGGSGQGLTTDSVNRCSDAACLGTRPASPSMTCPDGSVAGPACIQGPRATCGWAILSCPIQRGPSSNGGKTGAAGGGPGLAGGSGGITPIVGGSGSIPGSGGRPGGSSTGGTGGITGPPLNPGTGGNGTFSWTGNGQSRSGTGYYGESPSGSGQSFSITIASDAQASGAACTLVGQFASVPPPTGFYPMADFSLPLADGSFVARCTDISPFGVDDGSISGQVAISFSTPGLVEGSFNMHAARHIPGTGGTQGEVIYSGSFAVGCKGDVPTTDPSCAAQAR